MDDEYWDGYYTAMEDGCITPQMAGGLEKKDVVHKLLEIGKLTDEEIMYCTELNIREYNNIKKKYKGKN